jgi:hypothetical protein
MMKVLQAIGGTVFVLLAFLAWIAGLLGDAPIRDTQGRTLFQQFLDERNNSSALSTCYRANEAGSGSFEVSLLKREDDRLHGIVAMEYKGQVGTGTFDAQANGNDFEGSLEANGHTTSVRGSYTEKRMLLVIPPASKEPIPLGQCKG